MNCCTHGPGKLVISVSYAFMTDVSRDLYTMPRDASSLTTCGGNSPLTDIAYTPRASLSVSKCALISDCRDLEWERANVYSKSTDVLPPRDPRVRSARKTDNTIEVSGRYLLCHVPVPLHMKVLIAVVAAFNYKLLQRL